MSDNEIRTQLGSVGLRVVDQVCAERSSRPCPPEPIVTVAIHSMADLLTKEGWRPPGRLIETVEELDGLPVRTLVTDKNGFVWRKVDLSLWCGWETGDFTAGQLLAQAPITVLCVDQAPTECCPDCGADECECPDADEYVRGRPLVDVRLRGDAPEEAESDA